MPTISRPHQNPHGQRIRAGGMTLVNCRPECEAEFRSGSHESVIHAQLEAAHWQVIERLENGKKHYTYRCPAHIEYERGRMSGARLSPRTKQQSGKERKQQGRSSHDGGDS